MSASSRSRCRLRLNGEPVELRVRLAESFWRRLIGFWPSPRCHSVDVVVFPKCSSVHTLGMTQRLDVVFLDRAGQIVRTEYGVSPWRVLRESRASTVVEFRVGLAAGLVMSPGGVVEIENSPRARLRSRQRGSAMLEFFLAATLVLLPLISGILEFAQLAAARQILAVATSEAARSLAIATMDDRSPHLDSEFAVPPGEASIRLSLARGLLPLFGGSFDEAAEASKGLERWRIAVTETMRPDRLVWSLSERLVETPNVEIGRLEVRYCRELFFAPASFVLPPLLRQWDADVFSRVCYRQGRVPLFATAPVGVSRHP